MTKQKAETKAPTLPRASKAPRPINPLPGRAMVLPPSKPPASADWNKWRDMREVELWQAVALTLGFEPKSLPVFGGAYDVLGDDPFRICPEAFLERLQLANSNAGTTLPVTIAHPLRARSIVDLPMFARWAAGLWTDMPEDMFQVAGKSEVFASLKRAADADYASPEARQFFDEYVSVKEQIAYWRSRDDTTARDAKVLKDELAPLLARLTELEDRKRHLRGDEVDGNEPVGKGQPQLVLSKAKDGAAWMPLAQAQARAFIAEQRARDLYPSQEAVGDHVARIFRSAEPQIVGVGGKPITGAYIKRHALRGISSEQGKQLSTKQYEGK